ncbi:UPF0149 family protein [Aeromonas rivuli]|jgi:uncharacterized protein|uniref:UPF0149 family protein n=1 Tax=Aeromonas TaxID=642 RepID=UPI0005A894E8|nr:MULTISPECIES: UPF0149 family protein [Aeromonas]MCS3457639.1 yecA family protein [Aeromonas sp. BIGb0405]MCS3458668.1 yecA family protein [Aeromonas sp. BIGb0445]UBO72633.1 UPF0149 family protein [Aeromonas rivuli]
MSKTTPPNYAALADLMDQHELMATAVEAHGVICGLICGGVPLDDKSWLAPFNDLVNDGFGLPAQVRQVMTELYQDAIEGLMAQKGVELLLPSDDAPLDERIDGLVDWSQAFLAGFGVVQQELSKASEELQEMIQDIANITQVSEEFDQEDEENEVAFLVLYEHVKLGVMMTFEEFGKRPDTPDAPPTLH